MVVTGERSLRGDRPICALCRSHVGVGVRSTCSGGIGGVLGVRRNQVLRAVVLPVSGDSVMVLVMMVVIIGKNRRRSVSVRRHLVSWPVSFSLSRVSLVVFLGVVPSRVIVHLRVFVEFRRLLDADE